MKKAITFALIAILFLGLFAGCNTYRRPVATGTADGAHVTREFQYRPDGFAANHRTTTRDHGVADRFDGSTGNFYGSTTRGTTGSGMIGDESVPNRSSVNTHSGFGYGTAGVNRASGTPATVRPAVNGTTARTAR